MKRAVQVRDDKAGRRRWLREARGSVAKLRVGQLIQLASAADKDRTNTFLLLQSEAN